VRVGETALELAQRVFPANDPSVALSYEQLGDLFDQLGDQARARPALAKALLILDAATPPSHRGIYRVARRIAYLSDMAADHTEAIRYYEKAIGAGAASGEVPPSELGTLRNNVALIYRKIGRPEAAEPHYVAALEIYERQLGPDHPDVAAVLNNLGVFYANAGRFDEAEAIHRRALSIRQKLQPSGGGDVAQSQCNLAVVFHSRGAYDEASDLYRSSLKTWEAMKQTPPEDYEIVASNYADLLRSRGKARKAASIEARARKKRGS
jgi:tetratricopeptide (TPR) repeat protein